MDIYSNEVEIEETYDNNQMKEKHRKSRKSNRREKMKNKTRETYSINYFIGSERSKYGKKMLHKKNRRNIDVDNSHYNTSVGDYALKQILWDIT